MRSPPKLSLGVAPGSLPSSAGHIRPLGPHSQSQTSAHLLPRRLQKSWGDPAPLGALASAEETGTWGGVAGSTIW